MLTHSRNFFVRVTALSALTLLIASAARAQFAEDALRFSTFNLPVGARASGMGNTSVGLADDFSALFTNPAGLASLRNFEFSVGLSNASYNNNVLFFGQSTSSNNSVTNLNNLGLVYPVPTSRGSLSLAFGFARIANYSTSAVFSGFNPYSSLVQSLIPNVNLNSMSSNDVTNLLDSNIPYQVFLADTVNGRLYPNVTDSVGQAGDIREGGGLNSWSLGGAVDIAKDLSLGVTFSLVSGSYSYDRLFTETDARNVYHYGPPFDLDHFVYESTISSDITGYNLLIGLMYRKQGRYKIGLTVKTPTYYEISENFSDAGTSYFDNGDTYTSTNPGTTKYNIRTPIVLNGGASFQVTDWLLLAGDAEYTDWTQMEFTNDGPDLQSENRVIRDILQPTTNLRGGAELTLWKYGVRLRGGIMYNPSPYKGDPKDYDQVYYTAGVGIALDENVAVDASYAYGTWKTYRDNYYVDFAIPQLVAPSRTSESVKLNTLNVTLSYHF
jgi:long-subunit fatty acid transport protein